jgi:hypothetical protein
MTLGVGPRIDYNTKIRTADGMIRKYSGGGGNAVLRRVGAPDRAVSMIFQDFTPMERVGKMINPIDRLALVSLLAPDGTALTPPPDQELDRLVTFQMPLASPPVEAETLRIVQPPGKLNPGNVTIYYELQVRG